MNFVHSSLSLFIWKVVVALVRFFKFILLALKQAIFCLRGCHSRSEILLSNDALQDKNGWLVVKNIIALVP